MRKMKLLARASPARPQAHPPRPISCACRPPSLPRVGEAIFREVRQYGETREIRVNASYMQIYREVVQDLLGDDPTAEMKIRRDPKQGAFVQGLSEFPIDDARDLTELIERGNKKRAVASTLMNAESSRSHAIVIIRVDQQWDYYSQSATKKKVLGDTDAARPEPPTCRLHHHPLPGSYTYCKPHAGVWQDPPG